MTTKTIQITNTKQIANLPWKGNHASDCWLFNSCEAFIKSLSDREEQKRALHLMALHGMGVDKPVSDKALDEYLTLA